MAEQIKYVSAERLGYYDGKIKSYIAEADDAVKSQLQELITAEETARKAADVTLNADIEAAQVAADTAQTDVDNLETYVGTFTSESAKTVVEYIDEKTANIASDAVVGALAERVGQAETDIDNIEKDYLKAADKEELNGLIVAEKERAMGVEGGLETRLAAVEGDYLKGEDKTELNNLITANTNAIDAIELDYLKKADKEELAGLVNTEKERAEGVEEALDERLVKVEAFFETAEGETLDTALDTLKEIQAYLDGEGAVADQMLLDIAANKKAIEDHVAINHDFAAADATLKAELEGQIALKADKTTVEALDTAYKAADTALSERLDVLEAINHDAYIEADTALKTELNTEIAKKADQTALDEAVEALEGVDSGLDERIAALEAKHGDGEGSVTSLIEAAKAEAIEEADVNASNQDAVVLAESQKYTDAEIDKVEETIATIQGVVDGKAVQSDVDALSGKVGTLETDMAQAKADIDAVEALAAANKAAHEANAQALSLKATQADLEAVSGRVATLESWHENFTEVSEEEINVLFA